jgi:hypothetical protein
LVGTVVALAGEVDMRLLQLICRFWANR